MSGIAGVFNIDGRPIAPEVFQGVVDAIAHRGPDGVATWASGNVALAHAQFVTTPEDEGVQQPLTLGPYTVTCDGLLDNRRELLDSLKASPGCSDGELVLRAFEQWGTDCADRLAGDFAFALWDDREHRLFCARDALGMRVLHYYFDGARFIFASEISAILAHPSVPRQLNEEKLGLYLALDDGDAERTFYKGIYRLPGGYHLTASRHGVKKQKYWDPDPGDQIILRSRTEYGEHLRELFKAAVQSRMRSQGPVGVMLSGGLDSSSVYGTAHELLRDGQAAAPEVQSFSWAFQELASVDESRYVEDLTRKYPEKHNPVVGDALWGLKPFERKLPPRDEPFIAPYDALIRTTMDRARESGIRVLMTGQGGDEFLFTREDYLLDLMKGLRLRRLRRELEPVAWGRRLRLFKSMAASLFPALVPDLLTRRPSVPSWVNGEFARSIGLKELIKSARPARRHRSLYVQAQHQFAELRGRASWVLWTNQAAPQHQVEMRHPFFDRRLVEFLMRVPPDQKLNRGVTKVILRAAMRDVLPESILFRGDKASFIPLFDRGVGEREMGRFIQMASSMRLARLGYVDSAELLGSLRRYRRSSDDRKAFLFVALILEEWLGETIEGNGGYSSPLFSEQAQPASERR